MIYSTDVKNRRLQVIIDAIGEDGLLKIGTTGMERTLSVVRLQTPAFRAPVDGVMELNGSMNLDTNARGTGKARVAQITTASGKIIIDDMTVGKDGVLELVSDDIQQGQEVRIVSGAIAHA